jgi:1-phosphofructokinase family hexose kinase
MDKIFLIDEWTPGIPMRIDKWTTCVGGKGLNSSVVLSQLGLETVALGFFAGKTGEELVELLKEYGIIPEPVWVGGTNRIAHVIAEKKKNIHSHVIVGQVEVNAEQQKEFVERFKDRLKEADYVIFAGSIPPSVNNNFYIELIDLAKQAGVPNLIDAQKQYMIKAIKARPDIIKLNQEEFEWTFDRKVDGLDSLIRQARELRAEKDFPSFVITMAKDGILAFTPEGDYLVKPPMQKPVNAAGAGDSVSSTLAWKFTQGEPWKSALKWAGAVSAATVLTERTGDVFMKDVKRIYKDVIVKELS